MSFIQFWDMLPPARSEPDTGVWTKYILESSVDGLVWTAFEGPLALAPAYTDPGIPRPYDFTSNDAPDDAIYFRVVWRDDLDIEIATETMLRPAPLPAWTPTLGDVAAHIPLRTKMANGVVVGTFTDKTPPATSDIVARLIPKGVKRVQPLFDDPITVPSDAASARELAALWTAMLVELGLFSDQVENDQSPYTQLKELWDDATGGGTEGGAGQDADDIVGRSVRPSWQFEKRAPLRW